MFIEFKSFLNHPVLNSKDNLFIALCSSIVLKPLIVPLDHRWGFRFKVAISICMNNTMGSRTDGHWAVVALSVPDSPLVQAQNMYFKFTGQCFPFTRLRKAGSLIHLLNQRRMMADSLKIHDMLCAGAKKVNPERREPALSYVFRAYCPWLVTAQRAWPLQSPCLLFIMIQGVRHIMGP